MEQAPREPLFRQPLHPYTQTLLAALPGAEIGAPAEAVSPAAAEDPHIPFGCRYRSRCAIADDICTREAPPLRRVADQRYAAC
ncbi:oligopeptide/dipeptide ABC transporter ATP-binding protein, partial [Acinetobacter baumannii]